MGQRKVRPATKRDAKPATQLFRIEHRRRRRGGVVLRIEIDLNTPAALALVAKILRISR